MAETGGIEKTLPAQNTSSGTIPPKGVEQPGLQVYFTLRGGHAPCMISMKEGSKP
jgi:hypothetical protein